MNESDRGLQGGGLLAPDALYIRRETDAKVEAIVREGRFCHVLTSRQSGKSSLADRLVQRLRAAGFKAVHLNLRAVGSPPEAEQSSERFFASLADQLARSGGFEDPSGRRAESAGLTPSRAFLKYLTEVCLAGEQRLVLMLDEVEVMLDWKLDVRQDFFAMVRAIWHERGQVEALRRVGVAMLGVALVEQLMPDAGHSPFLHSEAIELPDFTRGELDELADRLGGLGAEPVALLDRVFHWTNGYPQMVQRLCLALVREGQSPEGASERVDRHVRQIYLGKGLREDLLLVDVGKVLERVEGDPDVPRMLDLYRRVLKSASGVEAKREDVAFRLLKLRGLVREERFAEVWTIHPRNRIFAQAFDVERVDLALEGRELTAHATRWNDAPEEQRGPLVPKGEELERFEHWAAGRPDITVTEQAFLREGRRAQVERGRRTAASAVALAALVVVGSIGAWRMQRNLNAALDSEKRAAESAHGEAVAARRRAESAQRRAETARELSQDVLQAVTNRFDVTSARDNVVATLRYYLSEAEQAPAPRPDPVADFAAFVALGQVNRLGERPFPAPLGRIADGDALSPDGNTVARGSAGRVEFFETLTGRSVGTATVEGAVEAVAWARSGDRVGLSFSDRVELWSARPPYARIGSPVPLAPAANGATQDPARVVFAGDGLSAVITASRVAAGRRTTSLHLVADGAEGRSVELPGGFVPLYLDPNGALIARGGAIGPGPGSAIEFQWIERARWAAPSVVGRVAGYSTVTPRWSSGEGVRLEVQQPDSALAEGRQGVYQATRQPDGTWRIAAVADDSLVGCETLGEGGRSMLIDRSGRVIARAGELVSELVPGSVMADRNPSRCLALIVGPGAVRMVTREGLVRPPSWSNTWTPSPGDRAVVDWRVAEDGVHVLARGGGGQRRSTEFHRTVLTVAPSGEVESSAPPRLTVGSYCNIDSRLITPRLASCLRDSGTELFGEMGTAYLAGELLHPIGPSESVRHGWHGGAVELGLGRQPGGTVANVRRLSSLPPIPVYSYRLLPGHPTLRVAAAGQHILLQQGNGPVTSVGADGRNATQLPGSSGTQALAVSADGSRYALVQGDAEVLVGEFGSRISRGISVNAPNASAARFSPDGRTLWIVNAHALFGVDVERGSVAVEQPLSSGGLSASQAPASVVVSPSGRFVAVRGSVFRVEEREGGRLSLRNIGLDLPVSQREVPYEFLSDRVMVVQSGNVFRFVPLFLRDVLWQLCKGLNDDDGLASLRAAEAGAADRCQQLLREDPYPAAR